MKPVYDILFDRQQLAVARLLPMPVPAAIAAAVESELPDVTVTGRWRRDAHGPFGRADLSTARAPGRLGARTPIEIELAPWSSGMTELIIRPAGRAPHRWGGRRRQRWYRAAHSAVDAARAELSAHPGSRVRRTRLQLAQEEARRLAG